MNRWAANNPERYDELGHDGYVEHFRDRADMERKRQKEEGHPCRVCGEVVTLGGSPCKRCERSLEADRLERESNR